MRLKRTEIIKALECCGSNNCSEECFGSDMKGLSECTKILAQNALTLINELTEENERLRANNLTFAHGVEKVAANYYNLGCTDTVRKMKESIIEKACSLSMVNGEGKVIKIDYQISPERLDQIAEEMIGEAK